MNTILLEGAASHISEVVEKQAEKFVDELFRVRPDLAVYPQRKYLTLMFREHCLDTHIALTRPADAGKQATEKDFSKLNEVFATAEKDTLPSWLTENAKLACTHCGRLSYVNDDEYSVCGMPRPLGGLCNGIFQKL